jgi:hypothetical protein
MKKTWRNEYNRLNKFMRHEIANLLLEDLRQTDLYMWMEEQHKRIKAAQSIVI